MGLLSALFGRGNGQKGPFTTDESYAQNRAKLLAGTPQVISQLTKVGVTDQTQLKLEYFFYTNTDEKAAALAKALADLGYEGKHGTSAHDKYQFVVTGWTGRMKMSEQAVVEWAGRMCDLGRTHDCKFDGWGTNPKQAQGTPN